MREKWRIRRGWIKVHAMVDVETNQILGIEITNESVQDDEAFIPLFYQTVDNCGDEHEVNLVLGDGPMIGMKSLMTLRNEELYQA